MNRNWSNQKANPALKTKLVLFAEFYLLQCCYNDMYVALGTTRTEYTHAFDLIVYIIRNIYMFMEGTGRCHDKIMQPIK